MIVAGVFLGVNNTLITQAVMIVAPVERPVASAAYGFVRFIGGGLAPYAAGKLAERSTSTCRSGWAPRATALAVLVLFVGRRTLRHLDAPDRHTAAEAEVLATADA